MIDFWASSGIKNGRCRSASVLFLSLGLIPIIVGGEGGLVHSLFYVVTFWAQYSSLILFDIYLQLIGEVIHRIG